MVALEAVSVVSFDRKQNLEESDVGIILPSNKNEIVPLLRQKKTGTQAPNLFVPTANVQARSLLPLPLFGLPLVEM